MHGRAPDANRHFCQQIPNFYKIALAHRQRIKSPVRRRRDSAIANLVVQRGHFVLRLLYLQFEFARVQFHGPIELVFCGGQTVNLRLRLRQLHFIRGQFIFCRRLLHDQSLQRIVAALDSIAVCQSFR